MKSAFHIAFRDEPHMRAHADQFSVPLDQALEWARAHLEASPRRTGWEHFDFRAPHEVGLTGVKALRPWTRGDFSAHAGKNGALPSHRGQEARHEVALRLGILEG